jgi:CRP-like cAMP-binding protein
MVQPEEHPDSRSSLWTFMGLRPTRHSYRRGDYLYTPEQSARELFLVTRGHIRLQMVSAEGRTLTMRMLEAGQICGHAALGNGERYDSFAQASSAAEVQAVRRQELRLAMRANPELALALIDELGRHYQLISERLDEVAFKSVPSRLASLLVAMARESHAATEIQLPRRTHQQLADMINAQRETVTKTINEFRALRLLEVDRTAITLLNLERLRELAAR